MIRDQVLVGAGFIILFAGFMLGYAVAWWQRGRYDARSLAELLPRDPTTLIVGDLETRFRRSQQ
ncbi:hypothetical protein [Bradyrhizobium liaoningense]|uniref:hypothetical protein n=1 Tax=Bradyrhizobium liaoningense TaxID=43992 RepID=UPI001BA931EE|nr:hypothetical protein [Bradyrhizobium liaoningense]MBR1170517.1 hypothetical protein [Bradyrhizobium liaoningense]